MPPAGIRGPRHPGGSCGRWPDPLTPSKGLLPLTCHLRSKVTRRRPPESPLLPPATTPGSWSPETWPRWGPQPPAWGPVITRLTAFLTSLPGAGTCLHHSDCRGLDPQLETSGAPLCLQDETSPEPDGAPGPASQPSPAPARPVPVSLCGAQAVMGWECPSPSLPGASSSSQTWSGPCWGPLLGARISPHYTAPPAMAVEGQGLCLLVGGLDADCSRSPAACRFPSGCRLIFECGQLMENAGHAGPPKLASYLLLPSQMLPPEGPACAHKAPGPGSRPRNRGYDY